MMTTDSTNKTRAGRDRDDVIISGSTLAAIWHMAWPLLLDTAALSVASFVDTWVAGKLGADSQAAISIGEQIWFFMVLLTIALSSGTSALVSRFWGARDLEAACTAARQSLLFAALLGFVSLTCGILFARPVFHLLGATKAVEDTGFLYMQVDMLSLLPATIIWIGKTILRAKGDARTPMVISIGTMTLTILLDIAFCIWPGNWDIRGIGLSWLISGCIGAMLVIYALSRTELAYALSLKKIAQEGISLSWFKRLFKIGLPASVQDLCWISSNFVLFWIFAKTGMPTACQAAFAIGSRIEHVAAAMPMYALGMSVSTIVGQNLGAKQVSRAQVAGWQATMLAFAFNSVVGLVMFFGAGEIARVMSQDANVIATAIPYLQIAAISEPFLAFQIVLFYAMQGAGYTRLPMIAEVASLLVLRLPIAYFLTIGLSYGPVGCWIGMATSVIVVGLWALWQFRSGVWKTQQV